VRILQAWVRRQRFRVAVQVAAGGAQRQDSVANGARALKTGVEVVLVHDAARPFVSAKLVARCAKSALKQGSGIAAVRVKDTIKWARGNKVQSLPRQELWAAQTPQAANKSWYLKALARAGRSGAVFTDEAGLLEAAGFPVKLVQGEYENIKITTPEDLVTANMIAGKKSRRTV
jgi:2-C-methyl-D-erythritol 4-phosphate cytidylyltransferase